MVVPLFAADSSLPKLSIATVVDILLVAILIYEFILLVRGRRAAQVLIGLGVLLAIYAVAVVAGLELLRSIIGLTLPYAGFALIVLFQSEIRRALIHLGRRRWLGFGGRLQRLESADEILLAVGKLAQQQIGALVILERDTGLKTFIESGVKLDAHLSRDLLLSIFQPGGELHDGAVIVQSDKIAAAACFLPLSLNPALARALGTRHRAAIGITEETDCLSIVVSEQTGRISLAAYGEIELDVSLRRVDEVMAKHFGRRGPSPVLPEDASGGAPVGPGDNRWNSAGT